MRFSVFKLTVLLCFALLAGFSAAEGDEGSRLSVGVVEFDSGIPEDATTHRQLGVFPLIRKAEARYLPFLLRQTLLESDVWGAVRILPARSNSTDLLVEGKILRSNGHELRLKILARDSSGRVWIDKEYFGIGQMPNRGVEGFGSDSSGSSSSGKASPEPFRAIYQQISQDLVLAQSLLTPLELASIPAISSLRYGAEVLPEFFSEYLTKNELGLYTITRMPARNDPMMARVERMQAYDHLFIDTADEQYQSLQADIHRTYDLWRAFSQEQILYIQDYERRTSQKGSKFRRGSFGAMTESYGNYEWFRRQEQNQLELANGFKNETVPTLVELDDRVVTLNGNLQDQYLQWRDILRSMLTLERGDGAL